MLWFLVKWTKFSLFQKQKFNKLLKRDWKRSLRICRHSKSTPLWQRNMLYTRSVSRNLSNLKDQRKTTFYKIHPCYSLINRVDGPDGKIFGSRSWSKDHASRDPCVITDIQILFRWVRPNSFNKHVLFISFIV